MRLNFSKERVLAVTAHPDDTEYLCAGTLARAKDDGAAIGICVLCQGDKGQPREPVAGLGEVRLEEATAAADLLGAELLTAGFPDGTLADTDAARNVVIELFRRFRPTLVLTHAETDYHADHRAAAALAEAASWFCTSVGHETESPAMTVQPELWWMDTINMTRFEPHHFVDISAYLGVKEEMLACHKSQLVRGSSGDFSPLAEQMIAQCRTRGSQSGVAAAEAFQTHTAWKRARAW